MRAGTLRHRIDIDRPTTVRGAEGGVSEHYEPYLTRIQAHVLSGDAAMRGSEAWGSAQVQGTIDTRIRIRNRPGLDITMRVRHQQGAGSPTRTNEYDILAITPADTPTTELWLLCRLREGQGFRSSGA